jgi:hypothetical protein
MVNWICLDIETANASASDIEAAIAAWKPPGNCSRSETIETKRQEYAARMHERAALMDMSPIICCSMICKTSQEKILFHCFPNGFVNESIIDGWKWIHGRTEMEMLIMMRSWLDSLPEDPVIVGHNVKAFDLPKIRQSYIRNRLKLPDLLSVQLDYIVDVMDTMQLIRSFSMELRDERFISLDQVARIMGIERPKKLLSGADIPKLYSAGNYQEIGTYCAIDCVTTACAFTLMTNQSSDLQ